MAGVMRWLRAAVGGSLMVAVLFAGAAPAEAGPSSRGGASTAQAATPAVARSMSYVALGDSYSSGVGAGRRAPAGTPCPRSSQAYPSLWARRHPGWALTFLACPGATTVDVALTQAHRVPRDADVITVTAGGNDVGFPAVLGACTASTHDSLCTAAIRTGKVAALTTAPAGLVTALAVIRRRAPHARIVVLGYPRLFEPGPCAVPGVPNARRRAELNRGADRLNASLATVARVSGARFVDVRGRFAGHGLCARPGRAWINGPAHRPGAYHPNAAGHAQGYLRALTAAIG